MANGGLQPNPRINTEYYFSPKTAKRLANLSRQTDDDPQALDPNNHFKHRPQEAEKNNPNQDSQIFN
jgi:hypothetical protein